MSEKVYEKRLARAVINQAIKDVASQEKDRSGYAELYISNPIFLNHCAAAEYPKELRDSLDGLSDLSPLQRRVSSKEILEVLRTEY